ncbi:uncharacterized protein N0V96_001543 [Colletotrichum fioriniae]|uniref:uncharacterized protein n=1 Tax=Colletotrichum fioriniae TaxID=710243 RepID=UPI0032DA07C2|nr:hypothetical protein N0V96_001543 [Colletotrichum fioriniae]
MHRFEADDWIMMFCGAMFVVFVVVGQLAGHVAFGEDIWMVDPDELTLGLKASVSMIVVCLPALRILLKRGWPKMFSTIGTAEVHSAPKKASNASSRMAQAIKAAEDGDGDGYNNVMNDGDEEVADAKYAASEVRAARRMAEKRRKFFSFRSTTVEPNESELELELGDKVRGEVRTQIRYNDGESTTRRSSIESGIHVRTTTTIHDANGKTF